MAMTKQEYKNDCMILSTLEELVPEEHLGIVKNNMAYDLLEFVVY